MLKVIGISEISDCLSALRRLWQREKVFYYTALETWDARQELEPLVNFLKTQTAKTWEKQIERAKQKKS